MVLLRFAQQGRIRRDVSMTGTIAFCGLDCANCEGYQMTQANDLDALKNLAAKWAVEYNAPNMGIQDVTCDGCRGPRLGGYCHTCPVRACAAQRGVETCAACPDYACAELEKFLQMAPHARSNLEMLRIR
jgi:hypothetical protein